MKKSFNDNFTQQLYAIMGEYEGMVYDIDDGLREHMDDAESIIKYLNDICCSMPLGLALRRYLCTKFGTPNQNGCTTFELSNGREVAVSDYSRGDYDITTDDVKEYTDVFMDVEERYNSECIINRQEARRLIKVKTDCQRSKMFLISFALHMDKSDVHKFLTDVLGERTYDYRKPEEVIALFCHSTSEYNSYSIYKDIAAEYLKRAEKTAVSDSPKKNYTSLATFACEHTVNDPESLLTFLLENRSNFGKYSDTAYEEFKELCKEAMNLAAYQSLSNSSYVSDSMGKTAEEIRKFTELHDKAIGINSAKNTEQLAKCILEAIPRATFASTSKDGKEIISNDFIPIYNGENGQKSKKVQTTTLPKEITKNLLIKDRIDDLLNRVKPVERKDLIFLKFFIFSQELVKLETSGKAAYSAKLYAAFKDECNNILTYCGMSPLYPANRFDNLILLSLASERPFEMFGFIVESSFVNEPEYIGPDTEEAE